MKDAGTRALDDLVSRRRQLIDMRVQETLRLGTAASKAMLKSLDTHIAWLDKRITDIDTDLGTDACGPLMYGGPRTICCAAFRVSAQSPA